MSENQHWGIMGLCRFSWLVVPIAMLGCKEPPPPADIPSNDAAKPDSTQTAPTNSTPATNTNPANPPVTNGSSSPTPASTSDKCATDADCVVTNFPGCCACPQCSKAEPRALTNAALAAEQKKCTVVRCNMAICNTAGMCPPGEDASHFVARCRAGECDMDRK